VIAILKNLNEKIVQPNLKINQNQIYLIEIIQWSFNLFVKFRRNGTQKDEIFGTAKFSHKQTKSHTIVISCDAMR